MICFWCTLAFLWGQDICSKHGMPMNMELYHKKWPDPECPVIREHNQSILEALKGGTDGNKVKAA